MITKVDVIVVAYKGKAGGLKGRLISFLIGSPYYHYVPVVGDTMVEASVGKRAVVQHLSEQVKQDVMKKRAKVIYFPRVRKQKYYEFLQHATSNIIDKRYDWMSLILNYFFKYKKDFNKDRINCVEVTTSVINMLYDENLNPSEFINYTKTSDDIWMRRLERKE